MIHPRMVRLLLLAFLGSGFGPATATAQTLNENLWVTDAPVRAITEDATKIYIGGDFTYVGPATGAGVPLGAVSGTPTGPFPKVTGEVNAVVPDGAGGWYVGGRFSSVGGVARTNLARVLADGSVAPWNPGASGPNSFVSALALNGSSIYVGGFFDHAGGQPRNNIAELSATTGAATAWNPDADLFVHAIVPSGPTVYVAGLFTSIGGESRSNIAALDALSGDATAWDPDANGNINELAVDGSVVYAGGDFTHIGGADRNRVAAISTATGQATAWNPDADNYIGALVVSGSTVYVGGGFSTIGGASRNHIAALDATTGLATFWNPNGGGPNFSVNALALSGTTLFVGGDFRTMGDNDRLRLAAVDVSSADVLLWNPVAGGPVFALAASGSSVFVGGHFTSVGGVKRRYLAAIDPGTGAATAWNPDPDGPVRALGRNFTRLFAGGQFTHVGGVPRAHIAELDPVSGAPTLWNPGTDGFVLALAVTDSTVYAGGEFDSAGGQPRAYAAAFGINSGLVTAWNPAADAPVRTFALHDQFIVPAPRRIGPDALAQVEPGRYVIFAGGSFSTIGGQSRSRIAALDDTLGAAMPFDPDVDDDPASVVRALTFEFDWYGLRIFVGGSFAQVGGETRDNLALMSQIGVDPDWDTGTNGEVHALLGTGRFLYAAGGFTTAGGQPRRYVAALDELSPVVSSWSVDVDPDGGVVSLYSSSVGILMGGFFKRIGNAPHSGIAGVTAAPVTGVPPTPGGAGLSLASAPNPAQAQTSFAFTLPAAGLVELVVFDVTGRQVARVLDGKAYEAGPHAVPFATASLKPGLYFAQLEIGLQRATGKFVVSR